MKIAPSAVMILLMKGREKNQVTLRTSHRMKIKGRSPSTLRTFRRSSRSHLVIHHAGGKGDEMFNLLKSTKTIAHLSWHPAEMTEDRSAIHDRPFTK